MSRSRLFFIAFVAGVWIGAFLAVLETTGGRWLFT